jgi:hypothetical protein
VRSQKPRARCQAGISLLAFGYAILIAKADLLGGIENAKKHKKL